MRQFSVSLVSFHPIAREGLVRIISSEGIEVLSATARIEDLVLDEAATPNLVIVDLPTPEEQIAAVEALNELGHNKTVVLAETFDLGTMAVCFAKGAHGYLVKDMPCSTLLASLRLAALGQKIMPSALADKLSRDSLPTTSAAAREQALGDAKLSEREHHVLNYLVDGDSNKTIARNLELSEATVKVHVKAIFRKLNVLNRTQAAIWAQSRGPRSPATAAH